MKRLFAAVACLLVASTAPAWAQMDSREGIALQNQILQLRRDLQVLQQNQGSGSKSDSGRPLPSGGDSNGLVAQLLDRVQTLEDQVRQIRGQVDRLTEQQRRDSEDLNKKIADMNFAQQNSASSGAPAPVPSSPPPTRSPSPLSPSSLGGAPPVLTPAPRTAELALQEGNAALARRDYATAEAAAREVLGRRGPRGADAQYLLAQAELGNREYQQAAPDFYDAYNRQRTGPRAGNALLGVANSLIGIGDKASACEALAKLRVEFPQPSSDIRDGELAARQRAACR